MAVSKSTYECYTCRRNGFPEIRVYLDGKTEDGKTIYKNEDMSPHQHKVKQQTVTSTPVTTDTLESAIKLYFDTINAKIDKVIDYLDSQEK